MLRILKRSLHLQQKFNRRYNSGIRGDAKWNHLRSNELLKKSVGDFIELPELPGRKPKGLQTADLSKFLLTEQRWQLLSEVMESIGHGSLREDTNNGLCLSGPHGVGKSGINYFLACVAYVRGWFLQYIPLCGEWAGKPTEEAQARFYLDRFEVLNQDLLNSVEKTFRNAPEKTIKDVLELSVPLVEKQGRLHSFLSAVDEKPVLLLFDEHNELWKEQDLVYDGKKVTYIPAKLRYFSIFTKWTTLSGPRLFTVYSGSAHSKFEDNLPSGEEQKVRYIQPFNTKEAIKLITELEIPKKFNISSETVYEEITGGIPRKITELSRAENPKTWRDQQEERYFSDAKSALKEATTDDKKTYLSYLGDLFETQSQEMRKPPFVWYDKGLFYIHNGCGFPLNQMAKAALFSFWAQHKQQEVIGKPSQTGSEIGAIFEREVRRGFIQGRTHINLSPYYMNKVSQQESTLLRISRIEQLVFFQNESEIPHFPKFVSSLLKPTSETFKGVDFILEDVINKQIVFVQTTTRFPHEHDKSTNKIEKLFQSGRIAQMLDSILKTKGTTAKIENGHFIFTLPEAASDWHVKILYLTSQHDEDVRSKSWEWKDVLVAGRETLQPLNLLFHENMDEKKETKTHK